MPIANCSARISHICGHPMNPTPQDIKQLRLDAGLTQREAANRTGVTVTTWSAWERGQNAPHPALWERAQEQLKV